MLETLAEGTTAAEKRQRFIDDALEAEAEVERTGLYYDGDEIFAYLKAKVRGENVRKPRLRRLRK
jgi:hypothetical protein